MKKLMKVLTAVFMVAIVVTSVFASNTGDKGVPIEMPNTGNNGGITVIDNAAASVWSTILTICQILAIAAVIFAGLRYMFASADQKADIKKSMGILVVGAILVFAATTVIGFVINATNEVLN